MNLANEFKVISLRECLDPMSAAIVDGPKRADRYWRKHVATSPQFNAEVETAVVLMLNARLRAKGHTVIAVGTVDSVCVHPREVFRAAIIASAKAIVVMHNHPSGDPSPSDEDIRFTRDIVRAGELLKIDVIDHVIIGQPGHASLKGLGYFGFYERNR